MYLLRAAIRMTVVLSILFELQSVNKLACKLGEVVHHNKDMSRVRKSTVSTSNGADVLQVMGGTWV